MSQLNTPFEQTTSLILSSRNQRLKIKTELTIELKKSSPTH
jgi:hypothetical protein